jgi:hypothetical protein
LTGPSLRASQVPVSDKIYRRSATSLRAISLGAFLSMLHVLIIVALEEYWGPSQPSRMTLVSCMLFLFFWVVVANLWYRRRRPTAALTQGELLVIFSMISVGSTLAGSDVVPALVHIMVEGTHQANDVNKYATNILPYVPEWIRVSDPAVVKAFYLGNSSLFTANHFQAYLGPFIWWGMFMFCLLLMSFSLNTIFRRQWSRNEHLSYPIIQLPVAMTAQNTGSLLSNRVFWAGFIVAGGITFINGIRFFFPVIPEIPIGHISEMRYWLPGNKVWDAMDWTPINLYPFIIGMAYMVPLDLLFSLSVFIWVWKFERIIPTAMGVSFYVSPWPLAPGFPYYAHQMMGVWMSLLGIIIWTGRHHLRGVLRQAFRPGAGAGDAGEALRYRTALIGVVVGLVGVMAFLMSLGITPFMVIPYAILLLAFGLMVARIRTELGPPMLQIMGAGPDRALNTFITPLAVGPRSWITYRTMTAWVPAEPAAAHADALKMAEIGGGLNRRFWIALLVVGVLGGLLAYWLDAYFSFMKPITRWKNFPGYCSALCIWTDVGNSSQDGAFRPNWNEIIAFFVGMAFTIGLFMIRSLGLNMPLHPIAYILTSGNLSSYWVPILIAFLIKGAVLRYGGFGLHRRVMPFFFGVILGQFMVGVGWQLVGIIGGVKTYTFFS